MTYPNWFKRHLNLTLVITTFSPLLVAGIIGALIGDWALPIGFLTAYVVMAVGAGWVLHRKARSLFWLFLFFVPFGFWILLLLGNKSENPD